ncbi:hypothetical protein [Moraxella cuniculi]|nr:hypothetical protein [Moraxella cuniculi]
MLINNDSIAQFDGFTHAKLPVFGLVMATGSVWAILWCGFG